MKHKRIPSIGSVHCTANDVAAAVLAVRGHTVDVEDRTRDFPMRPE